MDSGLPERVVVSASLQVRLITGAAGYFFFFVGDCNSPTSKPVFTKMFLFEIFFFNMMLHICSCS